MDNLLLIIEILVPFSDSHSIVQEINSSPNGTLINDEQQCAMEKSTKLEHMKGSRIV